MVFCWSFDCITYSCDCGSGSKNVKRSDTVFGLQNQERKVGKMTYKELLWLQYPEFVSPDYRGGCRSCPSVYNYESPEIYGDCADCSECWDREIPDKIIAVAVREGESLGGEHYNPGDRFTITGVFTKQADCQVRVDRGSGKGMYVEKKDFRYYVEGQEEKRRLLISRKEAMEVLGKLYHCKVIIKE